MKVVATYGLSDAGITVYAPPPEPPGFGRKSFEVAIDNIDADLFGRAARVRSPRLFQALCRVSGAALGCSSLRSSSTRLCASGRGGVDSAFRSNIIVCSNKIAAPAVLLP
jgi:hypothetical protein